MRVDPILLGVDGCLGIVRLGTVRLGTVRLRDVRKQAKMMTTLPAMSGAYFSAREACEAVRALFHGRVDPWSISLVMSERAKMRWVQFDDEARVLSRLAGGLSVVGAVTARNAKLWAAGPIVAALLGSPVNSRASLAAGIAKLGLSEREALCAASVAEQNGISVVVQPEDKWQQKRAAFVLSGLSTQAMATSSIKSIGALSLSALNLSVL